ncbi:hypothetical protein [Corynebacterium glucuronolyticum]|uniref:hypothetical protein n=1 Tax=Corynebacterium glucuronolyticum TaxID=39791 RepID=UPI00223AA459|nr:hypothetical protein [Corynebacterium glucuronolyticum]MCT1443375.1 hypothetical protein [Corynebacterium glucuronolyticum]
MTMQSSSPKVLMIYDPIVSSSRVDFRFSLPIGTSPSVRSFFVDYVGIDLAGVPKELHYNTALGILLNTIPDGEHYIVATQSPVPKRMADFWASYFGLDLSFTELTEKMPLRSASICQPRTGVTFGGGKDSACALRALSKIMGPDNVVALSFVHPAGHLTVAELRKRRSLQILSSLKHFGTENCLEITTDLRHVVKRYHTELYMAPLGVLLWMGVLDAVTISYEFCHYYEMGSGDLHFRRSRPEIFQMMSEYYSDVAGRNIHIFNSNRALTELSAFNFLVKSDPESVDYITMCESTSDSETRWCCSCTKCAEFVLYTAYFGLEQHGIDADYFFSSSPWAKKVRQASLQKPEGFLKEVSPGLHVESVAFLLKNLSVERLKLEDEKGIELFELLQKRYEQFSTYRPEGYFPEIVFQDFPEGISEDFNATLSACLPQYQPPSQIYIGDKKSRMVPSGELQLEPKNSSANAVFSSADLLFQLVATRDYFGDDWQAPRVELSTTPLGGLSSQDIAQSVYMDAVVTHVVPSAPKEGQGFEITIKFDGLPAVHSFLMRTPRLESAGSERFNFLITDSERPESMRVVEFSPSPKRFEFDEGVEKVIIRLIAKRNLEPWNWGRAATLIVEAFRICDR